MSFAQTLQSGYSLASLLFREFTSTPTLQRLPEPQVTMEDEASVEGFHQAGAQALMPVYHLNALAISRLTPKGGTVVDLGSGSARFLAYLGQRRPDLRIIGVDLSEAMVATGQRYLAEMGLEDRVSLTLGDMTDFVDALPGSVALISSVFSLHHLPAQEHLLGCLREIALARQKLGSGVWIFDFARPNNPKSPVLFPQALTPDSSPAFNLDTTNSLIASWSYQQMLDGLATAGLGDARHARSRFLKLYQTHWLGAADGQAPGHQHWVDADLPPDVKKRFEGLNSLFSEAPV